MKSNDNWLKIGKTQYKAQQEMTKKIILTLIALLGMLSIVHVNASCPCWKNLYLCPCTKKISKLLFIKNNTYAFSANEGLLRSDNQGKTWTAMREGLHWEELNMVGLVGYETNHFILATGDMPEFYEWHANEATWSKIRAEGIPSYGRITSLVQNSKGTLYASFDHEISDNVRSSDALESVYQSIDYGVHWTSLKLKSAVIDNDNSRAYAILQTKLILDNNDNLYVNGKVIFRYGIHQREKRFIYQLPRGKTQWIDTHCVASDIFILNNHFLGLISDDGQVSIKDIRLEIDGQLKEKQSWTFYPPIENIKPILVVDQNTLYMISGSNLYQLTHINDPQSKWALVKNGDANIPDITCLAIHNHQLYAAGGRMGQSESSIDVFPIDVPGLVTQESSKKHSSRSEQI